MSIPTTKGKGISGRYKDLERWAKHKISPPDSATTDRPPAATGASGPYNAKTALTAYLLATSRNSALSVQPAVSRPAYVPSITLTTPPPEINSASTEQINSATGARVLNQRPQSILSASSFSSNPTSPSPTPSIKEDVNVWSGLRAFANVLNGCGKLFGPLKPSIDTFVGFVTAFEAVAEKSEDYERVRKELDGIFYDLAGCFSTDIHPGIRSSIIKLAKSLEQEMELIRQKEYQNTTQRVISALYDVDEVVKSYRRIQSCLERLSLNANVNIWMIVSEEKTASHLLQLAPTFAAYFNSAESKKLYRDECAPDTRVQALERFQVWQDDDESEKIYWLNGMAGTGKTTLSYTLCKSLDETQRLAANFFCSRQLADCHDVTRIIPTIAYQLAQFWFPFRYALSEVLRKYPDARTRRVSEQCTRLLFEPLYETAAALPQDLVVVVEALDECDDPAGVDEMLDMLLKNAYRLPIRFFLTSRPEQVIRDRMLARTGHRENFELHLHELDKAVVSADITKYLRIGLRKANVTEAQLSILAERSGVLFIYAATVVRYVGANNFLRSSSRLQTVLQASTSSNGSEKEMNALYSLILTAAFDESLEPTELKEIELVLHTIVCARDPLTVRAIATLLGLETSSVEIALSPLRSVVNIESDTDVATTLHKSFPDYLLDPNRSERFHFDAHLHDAFLARRCIILINETEPSFNICGLDISDPVDPKASKLSSLAKKFIPGYLLYACRYWGAHLGTASHPHNLFEEVYALLSTRLLLWMEVMNLTKRLQSEGIPLLLQVKEQLVKVSTQGETNEMSGRAIEIKELIEDAYDFVDTFLKGAASKGTLQIYTSVLARWPNERPMSSFYQKSKFCV
ncbi:WD repeat-containing protein [Ceratobasidium sp. AG-Ba]|nr:WD repeat-containing protein [Ceratobasidium sp. AG-Ba]